MFSCSGFKWLSISDFSVWTRCSKSLDLISVYIYQCWHNLVYDVINAPRTACMKTSTLSLFSDVFLDSIHFCSMVDNFVNTPPELAGLSSFGTFGGLLRFLFCLSLFALPILPPAIILLHWNSVCHLNGSRNVNKTKVVLTLCWMFIPIHIIDYVLYSFCLHRFINSFFSAPYRL